MEWGPGSGSSTGGLCRDGAEAAETGKEGLRGGWTWRGDKTQVWLGCEDRVRPQPSRPSQGEHRAWGPLRAGQGGAVPWPPQDGPSSLPLQGTLALLLVRRPLLLHLLVLLVLTVHVLIDVLLVSAGAAGGGGQSGHRAGVSRGHSPRGHPHLTGEQTEARRARRPVLTVSLY